jgi:hypothetical protein
VRTLTAFVVLLVPLALAAPASARDLTFPKTTADQLKAVCDKAGGHFSQGERNYGCGTDCRGKPDTDCIVTCTATSKCTAQVVGARRPRSIADALARPARR